MNVLECRVAQLVLAQPRSLLLLLLGLALLAHVHDALPLLDLSVQERLANVLAVEQVLHPHVSACRDGSKCVLILLALIYRLNQPY